MKLIGKSLTGKQKRLLYQLFFSYLMFLVIPILIFSIFIVEIIINDIKERVINSNLMKLQIMQESIDAYINEINNCALTIANDRRTDSIYNVNRDNLFSFDNVSKVMDVKQLLRETRGLKNYIHSIYLYNKDEQIVICSTGGIYKTEDFYDTQWMNSINDIDFFEVYITDVRKPVNAKLPDYLKYEGIDVEDVLTFIFPLKYIRLRGAVAINVRYNDMFKDLKSLPDSSEVYLIVDKRGRILFNGLDDGGKMEIDSSAVIDRVLAHNSDQGFLTFHNNDREYLTTFWSSMKSNLIVISVDHAGQLFNKILLFKSMITLLSASILFVGIILSYLMSRRIYNPIGKVFDQLKNYIIRDISDHALKKNELILIYDAVNKLINKERETEQIIKANRQKLLEAHIMRLIMGRISEESPEYLALNDYNACLLISIDRYREFSSKFTSKEQEQYKSVILNICNQVVNRYAKGYSAILQMDKIVTIISVNKEQLDEFNNISRSICDMILAEVDAIMDITISSALGCIYKGSENIHNSFIEAEKALDYRFFYGYGCCIAYQDIKWRKETCNYFQDKDSYVLNYLKSNSNMEIRNLIHEFVRELKGRHNVSYESVIQTVIHLISKTSEYLASLYITINNIFEENSNIFMEIMEIETLDEMQQWLCTFYDKVISYLENHAERLDNKKYVMKIIEIIKNKYTCPDLDIQWIADHLNLSYSHVRRMFKEEVGINFLDYLNSIRVEHAKSLLANSDLTIAEIATMSGYNNDQSFNRFFKKHEGITPGMYRKIDQKTQAKAIKDQK